MVDKPDTRQNFRDGIAHIADAYKFDPASKKFADALGLKSQQALQGVLKRGSASRGTIDNIVARSNISRAWLFDRSGAPFPNGLSEDFGLDQSGASLEVDVDVLRNLMIVVSGALAAHIPDAGDTMLSAMDQLKYSDRGLYRKIRRAVIESQAKGRAAALAAARDAVQKRRKRPA